MREWIQDVLKLDVGASVDEDGVTYTYMGETKKFDSIEELFAAEDISIFYPADLPEHIRIENVVYVETNGIPSYSISFNTTEIAMWVQIGTAQTFSPSTKSEVYTNTIGTFYINKANETIYVTGIVNDNIYDIAMQNTFDEKGLLDSLKESIT